MRWVSFPGLGLNKIRIDRVAFKFFGLGLEVNWYAIIIGLAIIACTIYCYFNAKKFGLREEKVVNSVLILLPSGFIGARIFYVIFKFKLYRDNLWEVFNFREGGIAIYGGVILAVITCVIAFKFLKIKRLPCADLIFTSLLMGQAIGRWGNFFNMEAYGTETNLPWRMTGSEINNGLQAVHPTFLYESVWCLAGFIFLNLLIKRRKYDGQLVLTYMVWYGFGRFFIEGLRTDSLWLIENAIRVSQLISLIIFVIAVSLLIYFEFQLKKHPEKFKNAVYARTSEGRKNLENNKK